MKYQGQNELAQFWNRPKMDTMLKPVKRATSMVLANLKT